MKPTDHEYTKLRSTKYMKALSFGLERCKSRGRPRQWQKQRYFSLSQLVAK